jgi:hypothetical protein
MHDSDEEMPPSRQDEPDVPEVPEEGGDPLDLPWYGCPWPPYLPFPTGDLLPISPSGAKLLVGPGWAAMIDKAFQSLSGLADYGVEIVGVMHYHGALLLSLGTPRREDRDVDPVVRYALDGLAQEFERLVYESLLICEVCGVAGGRSDGAVTRTLCHSHALVIEAGADERALWIQHGWRDAALRAGSPPGWPFEHELANSDEYPFLAGDDEDEGGAESGDAFGPDEHWLPDDPEQEPEPPEA